MSLLPVPLVANLTCERPELLYLAVPVALAVLATLRARTARTPLSGVLALLRLICIVLTITALAAPFSTSQRPAERILALVDTSASVADGSGERLLSRARALAQQLGVPLSLLPFSKRAAPRELPDTGATYHSLRAQWEQLDTGGTDLERVLDHVSTTPGALVLLLSDGYETTGSVTRRLNAAGGSVRIFPLTELGEPEDTAVSLSQLHAPLTVKAQKSAEVRATITNASPREHTGTLTINHGEKSILTRSVTVAAGRDLTVTALSNPALEGLHEITATFAWSDRGTPRTSTRSVWLSTEKRSKVLLISGTPDDDRYLSRILSGQSYQLRSEVAQSGLGALGEPSQYLITILNNVPHSALPTPFVAALPDAVRAGASLVMIGGNRSFGLGGYIGSTLEPILPVRMLPPQTEKKRLNLAVQLVIDKSRSMAAEDRLEFAKAAGNDVVRSLSDEDYIGVIGFDSNPFLALPLSLVRDARAIASDRISRLFPRDRTNLFPALDEARRGLANVNAGRKHVIVLTDGKIPDAGSLYLDLIRQMRVLGMTVSTVLIGSDEGQGFFAEMARVGGGAHYQTDDPSTLPRIFLADVKVASGERTLRESPALLVSPGPSGVVSTTLTEFPPLRGIVESVAREDARTELVASEGERSYPLLASWRIGQGRAVAFTSDANARWSSHWMRWSAINEFWSDILESLLPRTDTTLNTISFDLRSWVEGGELVVDLAVYSDIGSASVSGSLVDPLGEVRPLALKPLSPGHYRATLAGPVAGTYRATLRVGETPLPAVAWSIPGEAFGERPHHQPNTPLLEQVARHTGGILNPTGAELRSSAGAITEKHPRAALFVALAAFLLLLEILLREFGPTTTARLRAAWRRG